MPEIPDPESRTSSNNRPVPGGYAGTAKEFLGWVSEHLACGGLRISDPTRDEFDRHDVRRVELVTGGYSDDEDFLGRISTSLFAQMFWASTHVGGLYVYEIRCDRYEADEAFTWLEVKTDLFERLHRARTVILRAADGTEQSIRVLDGAQLRYREPEDRGTRTDPAWPDGELIVEPIPVAESLWR